MSWNYADLARRRLAAGDVESAVLAAVLAYAPGADCPFTEAELVKGWDEGAALRRRVDAARQDVRPVPAWTPRPGRTAAAHTAAATDGGDDFTL